MEWLHTWGGRSFGYKDREDLYTYDGNHVGKFHGNEVYGTKGQYLGEVYNSRLITNTGKRNYRKSTFTPYISRVGYVNQVNYVGNVMLAGYEDFPKLEK